MTDIDTSKNLVDEDLVDVDLVDVDLVDVDLVDVDLVDGDDVVPARTGLQRLGDEVAYLLRVDVEHDGPCFWASARRGVLLGVPATVLDTLVVRGGLRAWDGYTAGGWAQARTRLAEGWWHLPIGDSSWWVSAGLVVAIGAALYVGRHARAHHAEAARREAEFELDLAERLAAAELDEADRQLAAVERDLAEARDQEELLRLAVAVGVIAVPTLQEVRRG